MMGGSAASPPASAAACCVVHAFSDCSVAQRTRVVRHAGALTAGEVAALREAGQQVRDSSIATLCRHCEGGEYRTTWLQAATLAPEVDAIVEKLVGLMRDADRSAGWHILDDRAARRCMEYHEYASAGSSSSSLGTGAATPEHYDAGSLVTLDVLLSPTSAFTGGAFSLPVRRMN